MPNDFFQFKQFLIKQDQCAMKVCTDSCVLGAVAEVREAKRILDIGAGTGLLSLMVSQRAPEAFIEAVEIDPDAASQALGNIQGSPWSERIKLFPLSLQAFAATNPVPYDVIISNPPFFLASLKSGNAAKDQAKHTETLSFSEVVVFAHHFLQPEGQMHILLPPYEAGLFEAEAKKARLYPQRTLWLEATPCGKLLRNITTYTRLLTPVTERRLAVREKDGTYTAAFQELLRDYYLIF